MLLKTKWAKEKNQKRNKKIPGVNENGHVTYQNPWDAAKAILRGMFTAINVYFKKEEKSQINNLHLKELEKEEQTKSKINKRKEITKIRGEINWRLKRQ